MPTGLCNAPGARVFQRLTEYVFQGFSCEILLVCLDYRIEFGGTFKEHKHCSEIVFKRIREANMGISFVNSSLFQPKVVFLGHVVSAEGIHIDPAKTAAVEKYSVPQTIRQLRSFGGPIGF